MRLFLGAVGAYALVPSVRDAVNSVLAMFATDDFSAASAFMERYGSAAAVVSFLLMVFQSLAAPLPAFLITIANANLFGWWQGAILSWVSSMAGAVLCFWVAKALGREAVEKLTSKAGLQRIDEFFERHGSQSVLIARLLPFISFDFVSYFAGLTSMSFRSFIIATGLGPAACDHRVLLRRRHVDRRRADAHVRAAHLVRSRRARGDGAPTLSRAPASQGRRLG